jgi:hypothetical protein
VLMYSGNPFVAGSLDAAPAARSHFRSDSDKRLVDRLTGWSTVFLKTFVLAQLAKRYLDASRTSTRISKMDII